MLKQEIVTYALLQSREELIYLWMDTIVGLYLSLMHVRTRKMLWFLPVGSPCLNAVFVKFVDWNICVSDESEIMPCDLSNQTTLPTHKNIFWALIWDSKDIGFWLNVFHKIIIIFHDTSA